MPKPENIIPPKKGEIRNPKGKPKGTLNRATIVKRWLEVYNTEKNPITGKDETLPLADWITIAIINKARKGDVAAFRELMDSAFGKLKEQIDHTTKGEKINTASYTTEELERRANALFIIEKRTPDES